jgi:hypothetical protein
MYRGRPFEFITISADKPARKQDTIDPLQMKKLIVGSQYLGRYY